MPRADDPVISETCPRCQGWVWHRREPCNCKPAPMPTVRDHERWLADLGARLKACRKSKRLSLDDLARLSGFSKTGLWEIEKGRNEPMGWTVYVLAATLGVTADYLLLRADG